RKIRRALGFDLVRRRGGRGSAGVVTRGRQQRIRHGREGWPTACAIEKVRKLDFNRRLSPEGAARPPLAPPVHADYNGATTRCERDIGRAVRPSRAAGPPKARIALRRGQRTCFICGRGGIIRAAGPPQGANCAPWGRTKRLCERGGRLLV